MEKGHIWKENYIKKSKGIYKEKKGTTWNGERGVIS